MPATNTPHRTRRGLRGLGLVIIAATAVVSLSGCIKMDAEFTIASDATATGTLALEFDKKAAGFMGIDSLESFTSGITEDDMTEGQLNGLDDCTPTETDAAFVYTCSFTGTAFTEGDGPWTITKDGNTIVMTVVNEGQAGSGEDAAALLGDASLGTITVDATFPGPITEVTGEGATKTSDTSVTITGSLTDPLNVTVRSDATSSGSWGLILVLLIALAVLVLVAVVAVVLIMRRRKSAPVADPAWAEVPGAAAAATVVAADMNPDEGVVVDETVTETVTDGAIVVDETVTETVTDGATVVEETVTETVTETPTPAEDGDPGPAEPNA